MLAAREDVAQRVVDVDALGDVARRLQLATVEWEVGILAITHFHRFLVELEADMVHVMVDGRTVQSDTVPRQTFESIYVPLPAGGQRLIHLDASELFALPKDGRMRSFVIRNISFENLSPTDLVSHGWHRSGYLFGISGADTDGWVNKRLELRFPATEMFKEAIIEVVRYPSPQDISLAVSQDGGSERQKALGLEHTEQIRIPLSRTRETTTVLRTCGCGPTAS